MWHSLPLELYSALMSCYAPESGTLIVKSALSVIANILAREASNSLSLSVVATLVVLEGADGWQNTLQ